MLPLSREIQARTRHPLNPGVITRDINGNEATNGQYLTPIGVAYPEFVEIDLAALQTPFSFDGITWLMDRRLSPVGCIGPCESTPQPLTPFPVSNRDPGQFLPAGARQRMLGVFPFTGVTVPFPPVQPPAFPIVVTPVPPQLGFVTQAPIADLDLSVASGTVPLSVSFTNISTGGAGVAFLWDFGDGTFSIEENPVHVFATAGTFDVTLTVLNGGGTSTTTRTGAVQANEPASAPTASFTVDATAGNAPLTVNFTDTTAGEVTSWLWSFGDGSSSTLQNPSHTYTVGGLYSVSLTATGPGGSHAAVEADLISVAEPSGLEVDFVAIDPTTGPAPLRVRLRAINVTGTATSGVFDFGDGSTATISAATGGRVRHDYTVPGVYTVTLTATDGTNTAIVQKVDFVTVEAAAFSNQAANTPSTQEVR
jgi:PKD repeat protein